MPGLKTVRKSNGIYHAVGTVGNRRVRQSLGTRNKDQAQELCAQLEAKEWKRHSYGEESVRTFEDAAISYMEQGGERRFLAPLIRYFRGRNLNSIKPADIRETALKLYPKAAASTRNRQVIVPVRAVLLHAHDRGWCGAVKVKQFETPKSRKHTPVDRQWLDAFMAEADKSGMPHLSAIVLFMNQTGARVSEAVNLLGEHVDLSERVALLAKTKTDEWSPRYLTAEVVTRMAGMGIGAGKNVFWYTDPKAVNKAMKRVAERAGIEPRTTHSAGRHSFGTNAMSLNVGIKDAMEAGGWKSAKLFMETYVHSQEGGRKVAAKFDDESGPIGMNVTIAKKKRASSFGKH